MDERRQTSLFADNKEYDAFTEKFKPKKTTDDCYTPAPVYNAVVAWVCREYGLSSDCFVRPFWPELDFQTFQYPDGCVVVDNPPFSLLAKIIRIYSRRKIRFFLFGPTMTLFTATECPVCYLPTGVDVTYANGAVVKTSFVTNLDPMRLRTAPTLHAAVKEGNRIALQESAKPPKPKYAYPPELLTAAAAYQISERGIELDILPEDSIYVSALDAQRDAGKGIFGGGLLLSEKAAAEKAAAEKAAAEKAAAEKAAAEKAAVKTWALSPRERAIFNPERERERERAEGGLIWE